MKMWLVATHVIFNRNAGGSFSCIFHGKTKSAVSVPWKHPFTNFKKWYSQKTSGWYIVNCFVRFGMDPAGSLLYTLYPRCKGSLLSCLVASFPDYPWCPKIEHVKKQKLNSNPRYGLASTPKISEHFLWTQNKHLLQKIEFFLTPFLRTAQGYLPEVCNVWRSLPNIITLVSPCSPSLSLTLYHFSILPFLS